MDGVLENLRQGLVRFEEQRAKEKEELQQQQGALEKQNLEKQWRKKKPNVSKEKKHGPFVRNQTFFNFWTTKNVFEIKKKMAELN